MILNESKRSSMNGGFGRFGVLSTDLTTDVCVIGGGIHGLSIAYHLLKAGKTVVVLDDGLIGRGSTFRTPAHMTYVLDERLFRLENLHGYKQTRLAVLSHRDAIDQIEKIVHREKIDCQFERVPGYLFATDENGAEEINHEYSTLRRLGFSEVKLLRSAPFPDYVTGPVLLFPSQAQFHPIPYMNGLARAIIRKGGKIFNRTHASKIEGGSPAHVHSNHGPSIRSKAIIVATRALVNNLVSIRTKLATYQSYIIGIVIPPGYVKKGLYWGNEDFHPSLRLGNSERLPEPGGSYDILVVGSEYQRTEQNEDAQNRFASLEEWTMKHFPKAQEVRYRWSGQIIYTHDHLAFIGCNPSHENNIYVVTGDSGNSITYSAIAGTLITDIILGRKNRLDALYEPSRVTWGAGDTFDSLIHI